MTPRVSIVTPYKDAEAHLAEAIASVTAQTEGAWELLLVDDGSSDGGRAIADAAAKCDPRVRSLVRPAEAASGAAGARNWGVCQSRGAFLVFLDADDCFLPDKLAIELALLDRHPEAAMTFGATIWWYPGDERRNWSDAIRTLGPGLVAPPLLVDRVFLLQRAHVPSLCSVMVRREILGDSPFEERFRLYEDQSMLVKVALAHPVYVGRHPTALYRQHAASTSARAEQSGDYRRSGPHRARGDFLAWVGEHAQRAGKLAPSTAAALALAKAAQSGDWSALTPRLRVVAVWLAASKRLDRLARRGRRRMSRLIVR